MKIIRCKNYHDLSHRAVQVILTRIDEKPDLLLCAATGNTPKGAYKKLGRTAKTRSIECAGIKLIQLDEWVSLPPGHEASCQYQLATELVKPLDITDFCKIDGAAADLSGEIDRTNDYLKANGPIDLCVLGLGLNGHIGLNEPAEQMTEGCHRVKLSNTSMEHDMVEGIAPVPTEGITLGLNQILESREIILLVAGASKKEIFEALLHATPHPALPASYLMDHPNTICLVDQEAYPKD